RVGALVLFGALARKQALLDHAACHLGQGRTVDAGHLDERGLAHALIVLERCENGELLRGEIARARLLRVEVSVILLAAPDEMRRCLCEIEPSVRSALNFHETPPVSPQRRPAFNSPASLPQDPRDAGRSLRFTHAARKADNRRARAPEQLFSISRACK